MATEILRMADICKSFPGVKALDHVSITCNEAEVLILAGENGAGKSTLLKILTGVYAADSGEIFFRGKPVTIRNPQQAVELGIAMVYQELTLIPQMTVAENIYLNMEPTNRLGLIQTKEMERKIREVMEKYQIFVDMDAKVSTLSVAQQQMAEILKILIRDPELIILDEPTSALDASEAAQLFRIVRSLVEQKKSIIFISHRMKENFEIGDRITVLKDGTLVTTKPISEMTQDDLIRCMVGRQLQNIFPPHREKLSGEIFFETRNLSCRGALHDISLQVRKGEILGIAGLQGHGQSELLKAISGLMPHMSGEIRIADKPVQVRSAKEAIRHGIALVPADRKNEGLLLSLSIRENLAYASLNRRKRAGFIHKKEEKSFADDMIQKLTIKVSSMQNPVSSLSGGNQQKVVLGKALGTKPRVLLFDEPTRGIDVEAKSEFYKIIHQQADSGAAVIMNSSDLMEVIGMSDRVAVMFEGRLTKILERSEISEETIMRYAMGL